MDGRQEAARICDREVDIEPRALVDGEVATDGDACAAVDLRTRDVVDGDVEAVTVDPGLQVKADRIRRQARGCVGSQEFGKLLEHDLKAQV